MARAASTPTCRRSAAARLCKALAEAVGREVHSGRWFQRGPGGREEIIGLA